MIEGTVDDRGETRTGRGGGARRDDPGATGGLVARKRGNAAGLDFGPAPRCLRRVALISGSDGREDAMAMRLKGVEER